MARLIPVGDAVWHRKYERGIVKKFLPGSSVREPYYVEFNNAHVGGWMGYFARHELWHVSDGGEPPEVAPKKAKNRPLNLLEADELLSRLGY